MEGVGRLECLVLRVMHDGRGQVVKAGKVRDDAVVLDDERVDDVVARQEPVSELFLRVDWSQVEFLQVLDEITFVSFKSLKYYQEPSEQALHRGAT